jgi:hypothetical protein
VRERAVRVALHVTSPRTEATDLESVQRYRRRDGSWWEGSQASVRSPRSRHATGVVCAAALARDLNIFFDKNFFKVPIVSHTISGHPRDCSWFSILIKGAQQAVNIVS